MFETVDCSRNDVLVLDFLESDPSSLPRAAPVFNSAIDGFLSWALGKLLTASLSGFCKLFSDLDISMLLIDDSMASSTMIEF